MIALAPRISSRAAAAAALLSLGALAGCGHSDKCGDAVSAETVEVPANEAMTSVPPSAVPVPEDAAAGAASSAKDPIHAAADRAAAAAADIQAAEAEAADESANAKKPR
jgi:hypothetical protein